MFIFAFLISSLIILSLETKFSMILIIWMFKIFFIVQIIVYFSKCSNVHLKECVSCIHFHSYKCGKLSQIDKLYIL